MQSSETLAALFEALSKAQGEMEGAKKTQENAAFKRGNKVSTYADLASGWDACRSALSNNGLAVIQMPGDCADNRIDIMTMLTHKSGEWMSETLSVPLGAVTAHGLGSAITYGRRYALFAMVGLAAEDDNGNAATEAAPNDGQRRDKVAPGRARPEPLKGPMKTRAEARVKFGEIVRELHACADSDMLSAFLEAEKDVIEQFRTELPDAWNGDGLDFLGLAKEIENATAAVAV